MTWDPDERVVPPMSAEMFSALVTARLRASQAVEILGGKGLQLKLKIRGRETTGQLERVYERYRANPEAGSAIVDLYIENLLNDEIDGRAGNERFEEVRELLRPRLMTARQWMEKRDEGLRLVIRSIADDLGEGVVIDRGQEFEYVQLDFIPLWDVDSQSVYDVALENLARAFANAPYSVNGEGLETLLVDHSVNASAGVLLADRMAEWQARVGGELVVGLPTHDLALGFARKHPAFKDLQMQVATDGAAPNGLLGTLLRVHGGALELLA